MGIVVPFPIRAQHGLLADLRREAAVAGDPAIIERCLRSRVRVYGQLLADKGVSPELIESEMAAMEWLLLGSVSDKNTRNAKRKTKRRATA
jgi:hypothetical protein